MGALRLRPRRRHHLGPLTGAFLYAGVDPWLETFLLMAVGLQASLAWVGAETADGVGPRDDEPHPVAGPRRDPDDMLNLAGSTPKVPSPITASILRSAAAALEAEGFAVTFDEDDEVLVAILPTSADEGRDVAAARPRTTRSSGRVRWRAWSCRGRWGCRGRAWLANALNLAEAADWTGEDRPHALGAWTVDDGRLVHNAFFPAVLLGGGDENAAVLAVRNLAAWGGVRARFAGERLPWLEAAAASRYPDDEPVPAGQRRRGRRGRRTSRRRPTEPVPVGPAVVRPRRRGRPRPRADHARRDDRPASSLVDPPDPAAFAEIDDAVAAAEDGDRILVRPGTYRTPVVVDRAVRIEGDGDVGGHRPRAGRRRGARLRRVGRHRGGPDHPPGAGRQRRRRTGRPSPSTTSRRRSRAAS